LVAELYSQDGAKRERAREALVDIGAAAVDPLIEVLQGAGHQEQWEAAKALGEIGDPAAAPALVSQLVNDHFDVRWLAAEGLIAIGRQALKPLLAALAEQGDDELIRSGAHHVLRGLAGEGFQEEIAPVVEALEGPDPDVEAPRAARVALYGSAGAPEEGEGF
jgi:HEAT repeat protein